MKKQSKKNKKILLGTLIPVAVIGTAAAITLPLVLKKDQGLTQADVKKTVDKLNAALQGTSFDTMSEVVAYLGEKGYDLEAQTAYGTDQYVWDSENNKICTIKTDGTLSIGPDSEYELPTDTTKIWKMVKYNHSRLFQSYNGTTEGFDPDSTYGQYLRANQTIETTETKPLKFSCGFDTGSNSNLFLKYTGSVEYAPKVVTNASHLEVDGEINQIDHYGHAKSITVTKLSETGTYNEYGTVDGNITLKDGNFNAKPACDVNTILIQSNDVGTVKVEQTTVEGIPVPAVVGTIATTNTEVQVTGKVSSDVTVEALKPKVETDPVQPVTRYAGGFGTEKSPYAIDNKDQLLNCQEDVNTNGLNSSHFLLTSDIDMTDVSTFKHIGTPTAKFSGTFDGQGYTISNLTIARDIEPSNTEEVYAGLFGWVQGASISGCTQATIWDDTEKHVNYDTCLTKYTTYIKNVTVSGLDNTTYKADASRYIGGIAGRVNDALIYNCHVTSGEIKGKKHIGGICGAMSDSLFYDCSTGSDLTIECTQYNAGGICGSAGSVSSSSNASCDVFGYCINNAKVNGINNFNAGGGNVSGIVGLAGSSPAGKGTVIDNCTNNGNITVEGTTASNWVASSPTGISSDAHGCYVISNCTNNGLITIKEGSTASYASGVVSYSQAKIYKCQNNKKISGYADYMAGVLAYQSSSYFVFDEFYDVSNNGEIDNKNKSTGITGQIIASAGYASIILSNKTYNNVNELNADVASSSAVSITLKNVTVKDTRGTLDIKPAILSVTSDKKVCSNVNIAGTSVMIDMPDTNITVSGQHDSTHVYVRGDNSNLIVNSGATLLSGLVGGANSKLINHGTMGSFAMENKCIDSTNESDGVIGNISFGDTPWKESTPLSNKHFTNYGTIYTDNRQTHTVSTISNTVKITIENYNTIKNNKGWYLFLFYTNQNCVIKSYAGSVAQTTDSAGLYATHNTIISYYQEAKGSKEEAKVIENGTAKKWTDLVWYIENHKMED